MRQRDHLGEGGGENTPIHARELSPGSTVEPRTNGIWTLLSVLRIARSVKLFAFGTPFHGQSDVWFPVLARETRERVAKNEATRGKGNIVLCCLTLSDLDLYARAIFGREDQKAGGARFSPLRNAKIPRVSGFGDRPHYKHHKVDIRVSSLSQVERNLQNQTSESSVCCYCLLYADIMTSRSHGPDSIRCLTFCCYRNKMRSDGRRNGENDRLNICLCLRSRRQRRESPVIPRASTSSAPCVTVNHNHTVQY